MSDIGSVSKVPQVVRSVEKELQEFAYALSRAKHDFEDNNLAYITGTKNTAALRRKSMDLTRALAEMRKGWK